MFRKLEKRAIICYRIKTLSDLHIGGHTTIEPAEVDHPVFKNPEGLPVIPGSSLKGVFRTEMERLLKGAGVGGICTPNELCNAKKEVVKSKPLCPICCLFGGFDIASSIRIKDATANHKKTLIRDGVAIDRKKRKGKEGGKFDIEAVPKGTIFTGTMTIENTGLGECKNAKLGALLSLITFFNSCSGSIGHAVSRGFGEVEIEVEKINLITAQNYLDSEYEGILYQSGTSEYGELNTSSVEDWFRYINTYKSDEYE